MDLTQLSQMVTWLDEEHRRDRDELARLDQRLQSTLIENQQQARRIQDLEGRLASLAAQLTRFTQIEQAIQQLKNEVIVMLDKINDSRLQSEREAERSRLSDRETLARGVAEVRKELLRIAPLQEELEARRVEDQRLGDMLLALRQSVNSIGKDLDERTRTLPYITEQRAQDNKRIAQIQVENVELLKRTDALGSRFPLIDERLQRLEQDFQRIQPIPDELLHEQQTFIEAQKVADVDRVRQMGEWAQEFVAQRELLEKQVVYIREFAARYEDVGRALKALEEFQVGVVRDQKQVAELQRLAEERQRKELAEWQTENEQRWKKELLRWDYTIQEQQKATQKTLERFVPLEQITVFLQRELEALWRLEEHVGERHLSNAQRLADSISAALEARPRQET